MCFMYLVRITFNCICKFLLPEQVYIFRVTFYSFIVLGFISYFLYIFVNVIFLDSDSLIYSYPGGKI